MADQITDDDALANGWTITYDAMGEKLYVAPDGSVFHPDAPDSPVANINRSSTTSAGFDFWTQASDLLKQGMTLVQLNQQQQAFNAANKTRAAQGLAPLPWTDFKPTASVGLTADPKILWVVLGVGALFALGMIGGGRRRR